MTDPKDISEHESHLHGPVSGPVHTGSGDIHYNITLTSGKRAVFDVSRLESLYLEAILKRPDLVEMRTPLGSVDLHNLYVLPQLEPVPWIYGVSQDKEDTGNPEPALDIIGRFQRIVIFGAPGIGKSTFLKFVLRRMLDAQAPESFPIFLPLYQYTMQHAGQDLLTFSVDRYFQPLYQGEDLEALGLLLRHWQSEGKLVFLLDGLDEVPGEKRERVLGQIRGLSRFVVTSRPRGRVEANQESGANYVILPFAPNEIARFVRKWQTYQTEQESPESFSAAEFFNYIRRETSVADLVRIPQLLTILCWLWGKGGSHQYGTKGELLAEAADRLIEKAVYLSGLAEEKRLTRPRELRNGLSGLALEMLDQARLTISVEELIELFENNQISDLGELLMLAQRSGLLIPTSGREDEWQFVHLVFQEYLAAEALVRHPNFETVLDGLLARVDFEECLRIASGLLCNRNLQRYSSRLQWLIDRLMADENTDIFRLNWRLVGLCLSEVDEPERRLGDRVAELEVGLLECASEWWARDRFSEAMGRLRTAGMRRRLVEALAHENPYARWAAAEALSQMADPTTLAVIQERIEVEDWPSIQGALLTALGRIGDPSALTTIRRMLYKPGTNFAAWQGIGEALGRLEDVETLINLSSEEKEDDTHDFSKVATVILSAYPYLSDEALTDLHHSLDQRGMVIRGGPADAYVLDEPTIEELEKRTYAEDPTERREAVLLLGRMGGTHAILLLMEMLLDENEDVCQAAGRTLCNMLEEGEALVYGLFVTLSIALHHEDSNYRELGAKIATQLWSLSDERNLVLEQRDKLFSMLIPVSDNSAFEVALSALLSSEQPFLLVPAIWIVGLYRNPAYAAQIIQLLEHEDDCVRWVSAWALGELDVSGASNALVNRLQLEDNPDVLIAIVQSVGKLKIKEAADPLVALLNTEIDLSIRKAAIKSLESIKAIEAVDGLLRALRADEDEIRQLAVEALGKIGSTTTVPALVNVLDDSSPVVQVSAARALGSLKAQQAESALIDRLSSDDSSLRYEAIESLSKIGARTATAHLLDLLKTDSDEECARAAADAIGELANIQDILYLVNEMGDSRDMVRMNAIASALLKLDDSALRDQILEQLTKIGTLGRVSRDRSVVQLRGGWGILTTRSSTFMQQYGQTDSERMNHCLERLFDEDEVVRWAAAIALEDLKGASAVAALIVSLLDDDEWVVSASAEALEAISEESDLAEQIRDERAHALDCLQKQEILTALIERLGQFDLEDDWTLPRMIRWALQDVQALPALMQAFEQGNAQVRLILWEIGELYSLRFMSAEEVILSSGLRVPCREAARRILSQ